MVSRLIKVGIAVLNQIFKLDSVMITKKEIVNSIVFYDYFGEKKIALSTVSNLQQRWSERQQTKLGKMAPRSPEKKAT